MKFSSATAKRGRRWVTAGWLVAVAIVGSILAPTTASASPPLLVDDDGAQCGAGSYSTISAALEAASDGDTIRVCPGLYREAVTVAKSVKIVGTVEAIAAVSCLAGSWTELDSTQLAILEPAEPSSTEAEESILIAAADDVEVSGLVIRNVIDETPATDPSGVFRHYTPAAVTSDAFSGYRIRANIFVSNSVGLEFGSSGVERSRAEENCFRGNTWGLASQRATMRDVVVASNQSYGSGILTYEIGTGYRPAESIWVRDNISRFDNIAIHVESASSVRVSGNDIAAVASSGINVARPNNDLVIDGNDVVGVGTPVGIPVGIRFIPSTVGLGGSNAGVVVRDNTVSGMRTPNAAGALVGVGITVGSGTLQGAELIGNVLVGNAQAGMSILAGNSGNTIRGNTADENTNHGIRVQGPNSSGNLFQGNHMTGNGIADARDDTDPNPADGIQLLNTWIGNECVIDLPTGAICD